MAGRIGPAPLQHRDDSLPTGRLSNADRSSAERKDSVRREAGGERVDVITVTAVTARLPVEPGTVSYPAADFRAKIRPQQLAGRADIEAIVTAGDQSTCLVNALTPPVFRGEGPSSYSRPGRIPGSVNAPWIDLIDPSTNRFRAPEALDGALRAAGVLGDRPVIAYCGGGISATVCFRSRICAPRSFFARRSCVPSTASR